MRAAHCNTSSDSVAMAGASAHKGLQALAERQHARPFDTFEFADVLNSAECMDPTKLDVGEDL